jgi:hypothetical protein
MIVCCEGCRQKNRVDTARTTAARCARCKRPLFRDAVDQLLRGASQTAAASCTRLDNLMEQLAGSFRDRRGH